MSDRFQFLELDDRRLRREDATTRRRDDVTTDPSHPSHPSDPRTQSQERAAGAPRWRVVETIGSPGAAIGQFQSPGGIAVDRLGNLYVADSYNHRVQRITTAGDVVAIGGRGSELGLFLNPQGIATDEELGFAVVEQGSHRVQLFTGAGEFVEVWGSPGSGPGRLRAPMGIARNRARDLFVADTGNARVVRVIGRALVPGVRAQAIPAIEIRHPFFRRPQGLCVDVEGTLYVADTFAHQVFRLDAGGILTGVLTASGWASSPGREPSPLEEPQDLAVDEQGRLYVVESAPGRLQIFEPDGHHLQSITRVGALGRLIAPSAVAVALDGSIYLADTGNHRILRLQA